MCRGTTGRSKPEIQDGSTNAERGSLRAERELSETLRSRESLSVAASAYPNLDISVIQQCVGSAQLVAC